MIFNERDINFLKLTDKQFEELCFELLLKMGYCSLIWRLGGADSGRDIEGKLTVNNHLIGTYEEKWFFECKRYEKGVPPKELDSKIAWANAEKPQHFVILTSSYLSNSARTWLDKIAAGATYHIRAIEGKELSELLLKFPTIMKKYFIDEHSKLLLEARKNWLIHNLIPEPETLLFFVNNLPVEKLSADELSFLWCVIHLRMNSISAEKILAEHQPLNYLMPYVIKIANTSEPIFTANRFHAHSHGADIGGDKANHAKAVIAELRYETDHRQIKAFYSYMLIDDTSGLEVLVEATSDYTTKIRYIKSGSKEYFVNVYKIIRDNQRQIKS